ncbi:MAG: hypothetical protein UT66_C0013G0015 [candidate division CPR2 bacterium GW2011_GWC1_39_9]|uniref:HD/PDEase domain-containing protein n=1 Tax=candidate division CPR2 bacterium GW2011_GWC2_39_10 TaxID=1618345 RepID=A0A0G0LQM1_UNCC2|nr:MAG: hypothetical protein UT18_C0012G0025 [candidate division CPR2 bacterium GW2011_GWC2_39_10]KKR35043.1 MAG: hypothetical protein UT66_C0013G0015 [candidate division CPR2 bacterium GW2011_GWC1_39_9]
MSSERQKAIESLTCYALTEMAEKYGPNGETPLAYHNPAHVAEVMKAALNIGDLACQHGKIKSSDLDLLAIAAFFHDIEQGMGSGANEDESACIAAEKMRETGAFSDEEIQAVQSMIRSTKVRFDENGIMHQLVMDVGHGYLPLIMADADLSIMGAAPEVYWDYMEWLLQEMKKTAYPSKEKRRDFLKGIETLLKSHTFFTEEAQALYGRQEENLFVCRKLLAELK